MTAYYNELTAYPAQWLRNLIAAGHIAPGQVDERSITEVQPNDLEGYTQAHFFAGIGVWSYALRLAGWPDTRPVWTGSCPCQPFSSAGKRAGTDDPRHLWPDWFRLIRKRRPPVIFGEQVASKDGLAWLDLVYNDLESEGYAVAAVDLCAAGIGAPHIRQRLYFVAHAESERSGEAGRDQQRSTKRVAGTGNAGPLAHPNGEQEQPPAAGRFHPEPCECGELGNPAQPRNGTQHGQPGARREQQEQAGGSGISLSLDDSERQGLQGRARPGLGEADQPAETNFWSDLEWLQCRDGKARPTQPGLFPLAHGYPGRVGKLRAYGNAIVPPLAAEFIQAYMEIDQ